MSILFDALHVIISPTGLLINILGTILGIAFGAMPGLNGVVGVALLLPLTYGMEPAYGPVSYTHLDVYKRQDLHSFDTGNVGSMLSMFSYSNMKSLDLSNFKFKAGTVLSGMFQFAGYLEEIDLRTLDVGVSFVNAKYSNIWNGMGTELNGGSFGNGISALKVPTLE